MGVDHVGLQTLSFQSGRLSTLNVVMSRSSELYSGWILNWTRTRASLSSTPSHGSVPLLLAALASPQAPAGKDGAITWLDANAATWQRINRNI